jgi:choice-of-anchor B domain-containing protein
MIKKSLLFMALLCLNLSVYAQLNLTLSGQLQYAASRGDCSDIWGYVDQTGKEYAIVGNENGTSIVDVSNPASPTEVFYSPGANTIWRDMKVWNNTAYITNEGGGGMKIIDLSNLPGPITAGDVTQYTGSTYSFSTAHNIFIDENGKGYILGANSGVGGAIILDLVTDPLNPIELGRYNDFYLHDVFVRGDTLWGGAINDGFFVVVDVSNPAACTTVATELTPDTFSHNTWLSDDGKTLYTTDEVSDGYIGVYDVSDINNILELDRVQSSPGQNVIPHNAFVLNDFVITSYYRDGITIHDATFPDNLIEVGNYDTAPTLSGDGFNGCWGVYPYFPSGNIIASDIEEGLFVFSPTYIQAAYLTGNVTDASTTNALSNVQVTIVSTSGNDLTDGLGDYATGVAAAGTYDVTYSKLGYASQTLSNVVLTNGVTVIEDVALTPLVTFTLQGQVVDLNTNPVIGAKVFISTNQFATTVVTNGLGEFSVAGFLEGDYDVMIGNWGYHTLCLSNQSLTTAGNVHVFEVEQGYSDFFDLDLGWTVSSTATSGIWERGIPEATTLQNGPSNPGVDSDDCGVQAFITGNAGGNAGADDIDGGETTLTSPVFDLSGYYNPYISFDRWFFNAGGSTQPNDSLVIELSNGTDLVQIDMANIIDPNSAEWAHKTIKVSDYITVTNIMQVKVRAMDAPAGHIVEAGFDNFMVFDSIAASLNDVNISIDVNVYPVPFESTLNISLGDYADELSNVTVEVYEIASGRVVLYKEVETSKVISIENNLASGIYLLKITSDQNLISTKKIIRM